MNKASNQEDEGDRLCGGRGPFPSAHALSQPSRLAEWRLVRAYGWVARCGKVAC